MDVRRNEAFDKTAVVYFVNDHDQLIGSKIPFCSTPNSEYCVSHCDSSIDHRSALVRTDLFIYPYHDLVLENSIEK
jgi:hypothetical protein